MMGVQALEMMTSTWSREIVDAACRAAVFGSPRTFDRPCAAEKIREQKLSTFASKYLWQEPSYNTMILLLFPAFDSSCSLTLSSQPTNSRCGFLTKAQWWETRSDKGVDECNEDVLVTSSSRSSLKIVSSLCHKYIDDWEWRLTQRKIMKHDVTLISLRFSLQASCGIKGSRL